MSERRSGIVGVVLAAGHGARLRPLTAITPKALCPVNNEPLLDRALAHVRPSVDDVAVNAHALADQVVAHVDDRARLSVERDEALGTAGALGNLKDWIGGRAVLVHNADAWHEAALAPAFVDGWDGERIRLLVVARQPRADFGQWLYAGVALLPWREVEPLKPVPSGLYEVSWRDAHVRGRLEFVPYDGPWFDCGTPRAYLTANLHASGGESVIGEGATIDGEVVRSVVWPGGVVRSGERLVECIRAGTDVTVRASQR